jgi:hypothetical protein
MTGTIRFFEKFKKKNSKFSLISDCLFPESGSEFLKRSHSSQNGTEQSKDNNNTNDWNRLQFFDTVGLICYAGRIQRYESYHCKAISLKNHFIVEKLKGSDVIEGEREAVNVKQYVACRWIQIIDESSKPLL